MKIKEYEAALNGPLRQLTLTLLLKDDRILLAMKKRGFGVGKWNGVGGKTDIEESVLDASIRETQEEIGVTPQDLEKVCVINFYHPYNLNGNGLNNQVHVFISRHWTGDPVETEEMKPQWFNVEEIPYREMWQDDEIWFPIILSGSKVRASFMFDENENIIDQILETVEIL